jgi:hypothetical protein
VRVFDIDFDQPRLPLRLRPQPPGRHAKRHLARILYGRLGQVQRTVPRRDTARHLPLAITLRGGLELLHRAVDQRITPQNPQLRLNVDHQHVSFRVGDTWLEDHIFMKFRFPPWLSSEVRAE